MARPMKAISISLTKSWKLSLRKQELKPEMLQVTQGIIHIGTRCKNHIILQLNWKVGVQEGHRVAIMLQAKEGQQDLREDRKEWKIFRELALA
jgi:hypothetical protein